MGVGGMGFSFLVSSLSSEKKKLTPLPPLPRHNLLGCLLWALLLLPAGAGSEESLLGLSHPRELQAGHWPKALGSHGPDL